MITCARCGALAPTNTTALCDWCAVDSRWELPIPAAAAWSSSIPFRVETAAGAARPVVTLIPHSCAGGSR